ncbi:MAG: hypothetical protein K6E98_06225 [Lachnospiraceae bacterium]|nr:hypothetical protein [Lachnospiraceae bacterium]
MGSFIYYCDDCNKLYKLGAMGKTSKCTQCSGILRDLKISDADYIALSVKERAVLKKKPVITKRIKTRELVVENNEEVVKETEIEWESVSDKEPEAGSEEKLIEGYKLKEDNTAKEDNTIKENDEPKEENAKEEDNLNKEAPKEDDMKEESSKDDDPYEFYSGEEENSNKNYLKQVEDSATLKDSKPEYLDKSKQSYFPEEEVSENDEGDLESSLFDRGDNESLLFDFGEEAAVDTPVSAANTDTGTGSSFFDTPSPAAKSDTGAKSSFFDMPVSAANTGTGSGSSFFDTPVSAANTGTGSGSSFFDMSAPAVKPEAGVRSITTVDEDDKNVKTGNVLAWILCFLPLVISIASIFVLQPGYQQYLALSCVFYLILAIIDRQMLKAAGVHIGMVLAIIGGLFCPPAYLFKRAKVMGHKMIYPIVSLVIYLVFVVFLVFSIIATIDMLGI